MYTLLVNLPIFSSGFNNFIKSFIKIFETSVRIYLINDAIVSIVDTPLRLPSKILLTGMQLHLCYEWLGQTRHQMWVGLATFARNNSITPNNF